MALDATSAKLICAPLSLGADFARTVTLGRQSFSLTEFYSEQFNEQTSSCLKRKAVGEGKIQRAVFQSYRCRDRRPCRHLELRAGIGTTRHEFTNSREPGGPILSSFRRGLSTTHLQSVSGFEEYDEDVGARRLFPAGRCRKQLHGLRLLATQSRGPLQGVLARERLQDAGCSRARGR